MDKKYQVFGEGALFPNKDGIAIRSGTVIAAENVQLLCLSKVKFEQLLDSGTLDNECMAKLEHIARRPVLLLLSQLQLWERCHNPFWPIN